MLPSSCDASQKVARNRSGGRRVQLDMKRNTSTALRGPRFRAIAAHSILGVAAVAAIAACGTTPAPSGSSGGSSGAKPTTSLTVSVQNGQGQVSKHFTLNCGPGGAAGGTHPHAAAACRGLLALKNPFASRRRARCAR